MKKIIFIITFICLIFGTNNYQELNNISIITNIGIDKINSTYNIIYQEIIPIKSDNKLQNKYKYYEVSGTTLDECFKKINEIISKNIYYDHLENIIITSNNSNIIKNLNNYFKNDLDNFNIVFAKNNIKKIIKYNNNYKYINSIIKNKIDYRTYKKSKIEHKKIRIPIIEIKDDILIFYKYKELGEIND